MCQFYSSWNRYIYLFDVTRLKLIKKIKRRGMIANQTTLHKGPNTTEIKNYRSQLGFNNEWIYTSHCWGPLYCSLWSKAMCWRRYSSLSYNGSPIPIVTWMECCHFGTHTTSFYAYIKSFYVLCLICLIKTDRHMYEYKQNHKVLLDDLKVMNIKQLKRIANTLIYVKN